VGKNQISNKWERGPVVGMIEHEKYAFAMDWYTSLEVEEANSIFALKSIIKRERD
jgi:hypothetical protein